MFTQCTFPKITKTQVVLKNNRFAGVQVCSFCFYVPVLQFVGAGDDPRSCRFSQMMEQRLEKVFSEAQAKVLNINSRLSVQVPQQLL